MPLPLKSVNRIQCRPGPRQPSPLTIENFRGLTTRCSLTTDDVLGFWVLGVDRRALFRPQDSKRILSATQTDSPGHSKVQIGVVP